MNLRCVQCQGSLLGSEILCPQCGRRVDADGNGLPDDLDARVQAAARAAVAEARIEDATQASDGTRQKALELAERRLRANRETPRLGEEHDALEAEVTRLRLASPYA